MPEYGDQANTRCQAGRAWVHQAIAKVEADANRSADTHLLVFPLPEDWGIDLYLKDESTHPTGSLKHRLARSLFLYALCNGWIAEGRPVIEASSGSTAVSEAYFARMLGLPFIAVMPESTSQEKIALIEFYGGQSHLVDDPTRVVEESRRLAASSGGHFMDQFTYAERATDWRGNNNIAESIYDQLAPGAPSGPCLDRRRRRDWRHQRDHWPLHPLPAPGDPPVRGRPGELRVLPRLGAGRSRLRHRPRLADRGHRPAAGRAVVHAGDRRPDDPGPGRRLDRRDAAAGQSHRFIRRAARPGPGCAARSASLPRCTRPAPRARS